VKERRKSIEQSVFVHYPVLLKDLVLTHTSTVNQSPASSSVDAISIHDSQQADTDSEGEFIFPSEDENDVHSLEYSSEGEFIFSSDEEDENDICSSGTPVFPSEDSCSSDDEATPSSSNINCTAASSCIGKILVSTCSERKCLMHLTALDVFDSQEKCSSKPAKPMANSQH